VDLETVAPTPQSEVKRLCPEHKEPLKQQYLCLVENDVGDTGHVIPWGGWAEGVKTGKGWRVLESGERPRFNKVDGLELIPVPVAQLEASTFTEGSIYYCKPSSEVGATAWQMIHEILRTNKIALVTKGSLRDSSTTQKLWRLELFRDYVVLHQITFPENIKPTPDRHDVKIDRTMKTLVNDFVQAMLTEWDSVDTVNAARQRFQQWTEQGEEFQTSPATKETGGTIQDLQDALRESIEKVKQQK
jgi:hypothetical protein